MVGRKLCVQWCGRSQEEEKFNKHFNLCDMLLVKSIFYNLNTITSILVDNKFMNFFLKKNQLFCL